MPTRESPVKPVQLSSLCFLCVCVCVLQVQFFPMSRHLLLLLSKPLEWSPLFTQVNTKVGVVLHKQCLFKDRQRQCYSDVLRRAEPRLFLCVELSKDAEGPAGSEPAASTQRKGMPPRLFFDLFLYMDCSTPSPFLFDETIS